MSLTTLRRMTLSAMIFLQFCGCGYFSGSKSDVDADVAELESKESMPQAGREAVAKVPAAPVQERVLELKLKVNDPFPLSKSVEQRLTETDSSGAVSVSASKTEMMLSLNVDEIHNDGRKKMTVKYHRIQYEHDIRGAHIFYSSDRPTDSIPKTALLYAGLADNWFSFVVGPNNKVIEILGFNEFLERCLSKIPSHDVANVRQQLEASAKSDDGIATFIDDSIGILPYSNDPAHPGVAVTEGTRWDLEPRQTENPLPLRVTTTCVLNELNTNSAEISLFGRITGPANPIIKRGSSGAMKILVKGGYCTGSCRVDRLTGLPTQSRIQRFLELVMELPSGQKVQQAKETLSTVTSFLNAPQHTPLTTEQKNNSSEIQHALGNENHRQAQQAGGIPKN